MAAQLNEPLRIVACLVGAMIISWRLTLLSLVFAPLSSFSIVWLNRKIRNISRSFINRSHGYHHVMLEVFSSLQTVQAYTMEDYERERFSGATKQLRHTAILAAYYNALANPITEIFGIGMLCTALAGAAYLLINHQTTIFGITIATRPLTIPSLTVFFGLMIGAADPLRKMSNVITSINTGMAAANMLYPLLDMQSKIVDPAEPKHVATPHHQIEFRDVGFSYDGSHYVLRNVNLKIPFGERLAIIGPNGGGKSTLTNLLCRFFDPQQGKITVDGVSLKDMALADLRGRIALVTQQTELFNETILHNIRYGCWTATDEAVIEAAKQAKAHDFVRGFPEGYQTLVGPNGQRAERRPEAADRPGPGYFAKCRNSDSRRGHEPDRRGKRKLDPRRAGRIRQGADDADGLASQEHAGAGDENRADRSWRALGARTARVSRCLI